MQARQANSPTADQALSQLCEAYWRPLYAFFRRQVHHAEDAQDLTQGLFVSLLQRDFVHNVDADRGRLRAFLIAAARHFLSNEQARQRTVKRGGGIRHLSIDWTAAEDRFQSIDRGLSADTIFDREWAVALLDRVLQQLQQDYAGRGKQRLFDLLSPALSEGEFNYESVCRELKVSNDAARVALHRLRRKYRELLRREIAETTEHDRDIDDELQELFRILLAARPA